ncbi:MAG: hypothetical protein QOJ91_1574 [Sphingomonadales bacterium]|nr:hypothetical protein [Sphingomonadales bacterium]
MEIVIPAKAGTSGQAVSAGLPEIPAFAGMTDNLYRRPSPSTYLPWPLPRSMPSPRRSPVSPGSGRARRAEPCFT